MSQLPNLFFIRARVRDDPNPLEARYCLITSRHIEHPEKGRVWKLDIIEGSKHLVTSASLREDGIETRPEVYQHERDTRLDPSGVFYYECKMWRTNKYMILPGEGLVWQYDMTHANKVLPSRFNHVGSGRDGCKKWYFTLQDLQARTVSAPVIPVVSLPKSKIPTHVFHAFVELAISKREECPISMEPLTRENVACPPCGHLFEKEGLKRALTSSGVCPTCRAVVTVEDLQVW